ncbi:hypothetical protein CR513_13396, partial [Mucuna pruriens]
MVANLQEKSEEQVCLHDEATQRQEAAKICHCEVEKCHQEALRLAEEREAELRRQLEGIRSTRRKEDLAVRPQVVEERDVVTLKGWTRTRHESALP